MSSPISERLQFVLDAVNGGAVVNELQRIGATGENSQSRLQQRVKDTEAAFAQQGRTGGTALAVIGDGASRSTTTLGRMSERLGVTESTLRTGIATAASVGFGVLVAKAGEAVNRYVDLAGEVRNFQRASGASAEESSRFVAVLDDLQISADQGSAAIGKLARVDPGKLAEFGIEVERASDGTVSLTETLLNVADAYARTEDPQQRALLGNAAFGRSYQQLIPLLEQGRSGLQSYFDGVSEGQVYTQEALDQTRQYELAIDSLQDALADFGQAFGSTVVPALTNVVNAGAGVITFLQDLPGPVQDFGTSIATAGVAGLALNKVLDSLSGKEGRVGQLAGSLSSFGRFGTVGLAIGAGLPVYDALDAKITELLDGTPVTDVNRMTTALEALGRSGSVSGALGDIGGIKGFTEALSDLNNQGDLNSSGLLDDLNGLVTLDFSNAWQEIDTIDQALAGLVENGNADVAADAVKRLQQAAQDAGYTAADVTALLPGYAGALEDVDLAAQNAAAGTDAHGEAAAGTAEQVDVYTGAMQRLRDLLDETNDRTLGLAEADIAARDALADFTAKVQENVAAGTENALSLDRATQAGRDNESALIDQIQAAQDLAVATAEQTGSTEAGRQAFQTQIGAIRDNMIALGFNRDQVDRLIGSYGRVPDQVSTTVGVNDQASARLAAIQEWLRNLDGDTATVVVKAVNQAANYVAGFNPFKRATGGAVEPGTDYMVGEIRPELFRPAVPGTIVPNTGAQADARRGRSGGPLMNVESMVVRNDRDIDRVLDGLAWAAATR